jgi:hypothetical protein
MLGHSLSCFEDHCRICLLVIPYYSLTHLSPKVEANVVCSIIACVFSYVHPHGIAVPIHVVHLSNAGCTNIGGNEIW